MLIKISMLIQYAKEEQKLHHNFITIGWLFINMKHNLPFNIQSFNAKSPKQFQFFVVDIFLSKQNVAFDNDPL